MEIQQLLNSSSKILVIVGAGISTNLGMPDFRSKNGIYNQLLHLFPEIGEPEMFFHLEFYKEDTDTFYQILKKIIRSTSFSPSKIHQWLKEIENEGRLLRLYTQNIDGLEDKAGIANVIYCHGRWDSAVCLKCKKKVVRNLLETYPDIWCKCKGLLKPDVVFYGERLPDAYFNNISSDCKDADLVLVLGTSLSARPVSEIMFMIPKQTKKVCINRSVPKYSKEFDVLVLDDIENVLIKSS